MSICILAFPSNHLCRYSSCSNSLSSGVRGFHISKIQSNPCSCPCPYSCLVLAVRAVLASLCPCPCRACLCLVCQTHRCPLGRLLLGVTNLLCFTFRPAWPLHSQYVLISSLKTPYEFSLARFNCTCYSRSSGNKASSELMRMSSARMCAFPWASR